MTAQGTALQAQQLPHDLPKVLRRFGRQCRGMGKMCVTRVRQTERPLRTRGDQVRPLAQAAHAYVHGAPQLSEAHRARLDDQRTAALEAHQRIAQQSRRLTQGKTLPHGTIVNAYDATIAPICQGKSHCPAQVGRQPGMITEPAAGFIFGLQLPVGNPSDASSVQPLLDKVQQAMARISTDPTPAIRSLAGDLAFHDPSLREAWHQHGILTVGIPHTVDPLPASPAPEDVLRILSEAGLPRTPTPCQVQLAYASGHSRPFVESILASLLHRGAARLTDNGHRGASVQLGMAAMAHNAATLVRIHEYRLSKRARTFRRRLRLRCRQVSQCHASIH